MDGNTDKVVLDKSSNAYTFRGGIESAGDGTEERPFEFMDRGEEYRAVAAIQTRTVACREIVFANLHINPFPNQPAITCYIQNGWISTPDGDSEDPAIREYASKVMRSTIEQ